MLGVDVQLVLKTAMEFAEKMIKNLEPTVLSMFFSLVLIDLVLSFLFDESDGLNIFIKLIKKVLYYSFFLYIIKEYKTITFHYLFEGFVQLGNVATTGSMSTVLDFGLMNKFGISISEITGGFLSALGFAALDYSGLESATTVGLMAIAAYIMFFLMLYVQIMTTFIKFYFMSGFAFVLMPFAGFEKTKDITLKGLNGLFGQAVEVFVLICLLNFLDYLDDYSFFSVSGSIKETIWTRWMLILFMYFLVNKSGTIASSMLSGAIASIGIGAAAQSSAGSKVSSAPGRLLAKDLSNASYKNARDKSGEGNSGSMIYKMASQFSNKKSGDSNQGG